MEIQQPSCQPDNENLLWKIVQVLFCLVCQPCYLYGLRQHRAIVFWVLFLQ